MMSLKKEKKEEEERDGGNPYSNLEKTSVLQEARFVQASYCDYKDIRVRAGAARMLFFGKI